MKFFICCSILIAFFVSQSLAEETETTSTEAPSTTTLPPKPAKIVTCARELAGKSVYRNIYQAEFYAADMNLRMCRDHCQEKGFRYASVQSVNCYCGNNFGHFGTDDSLESCDIQCPGDEETFCGGNPVAGDDKGYATIVDSEHPCNDKATCNNQNCIPVPKSTMESSSEDADVTPALYNCSCGTGYKGVHCEMRSCASKPCFGSSKCRNDAKKGFHCTCSPPEFYSQPYCKPKEMCNIKPCANGICLSNIKLPGVYRCLCKDGFEGQNCNRKIENPCKKNPCGNGECTRDKNLRKYSCKCAPNFKLSDNEKTCVLDDKKTDGLITCHNFKCNGTGCIDRESQRNQKFCTQKNSVCSISIRDYKTYQTYFAGCVSTAQCTEGGNKVISGVNENSILCCSKSLCNDEVLEILFLKVGKLSSAPGLHTLASVMTLIAALLVTKFL